MRDLTKGLLLVLTMTVFVLSGCEKKVPVNLTKIEKQIIARTQEPEVQSDTKAAGTQWPSGLERIAEIKDEHFESPDHEWAKWVVVNNAPSRIHFPPWSDAKIQEYLDKYIPDHIGEWGGPSFNRGDYCRMRGIASNTTHEYGSNEDLNELGGHTMGTMADNGIAREEDGSFASGGWAGSYLMCQNSPKWHGLQMQSPMRQAVYGESIFHDKFETVLRGMYQGFCRWCNIRFKDYMQDNFNLDELAQMDFVPDQFDLVSYVAAKRKSLSPAEMLEDLVIHEYIRFQYSNHLYWAVDVIDQYHQSAAKAGFPIPAFYGNQSGVWGSLPYAVSLSDQVDIVWVEQAHSFQRPLDSDVQAFSTLLWKIGRAASHYKKAVWALEYQAGRAESWPMGFGADKKYPTALANAEATANGGVQCQTWVATPYNNKKISDALLQAHSHHAHFVDANRGLFVDRNSVVDHALVYSVPSMMWRVCYSFTLRDWPYTEHFGAAGRLLEDSHIPYNVLMFGQKDIFDDSEDIASLGNYKTIVIPYADCISNKQADAVKDWVRSGGKLVLWANEIVGTRDQDMLVRSTPVFKDLIENPGLGKVEVISTELANSYIASSGSDASKIIATSAGTAETIKTVRAKDGAADFNVQTLMSKVVDADMPVIKIDAPETVWLNVWRHGAGPMVSVQMFNNDLNVEEDTYNEVENFTVSLRQPDGVTFTEVNYYNTGYSGQVPTVPTSLSFVRKGDYLEVAVPRLDMFGIVVFSVNNELEVRMEAAHTRKWFERLKIALRCPSQNTDDYVVLLTETESLLGQVQGDVMVSDFGSLIQPLKNMEDQLQLALDAVTSSVAKGLKADEDAIVNVTAYKKFDFGESGTPSGWREVKTDTLYSKSTGFGWESVEYKTAASHGDADLLHRDFIRSKDPFDGAVDYPGNRQFPYTDPDTHEGNFNVDLPNGDYIVTVITGDHDEYRTERGGPANEGRTAMTCVDAEGMPMVYGDRGWGGYYQNRAFRVSVNDGQLNLRFSGRAVGPFYCNPIEWMVNALIVQQVDQEITPAAKTYLEKAELLSASAIRDWNVIGPFDDDDCVGLEKTFGPEKSIDVDKTYQGKGGVVSWQQLPALTGSAPYVSFADTFSDIDEVAGFALSYVYSPSEAEAILISSISQMGTIYVNGQEIYVEKLAAGLLPDEQYVKIDLKAGWNSIMVKALNHWGKDFSFWVGLLTKDAKPLIDEKGVKIAARKKNEIESD